MRVFKFKLKGTDELFHHMAVDSMDAILDICELFACEESDIVAFEQVEPISSRRPQACI